ncbi:hypothetical protein DFH06DRAFT_1142762 [Mycena polygramma]|nr:hypothetical protein DFH06DRAFT_1142762 [Mycena polygramma]
MWIHPRRMFHLGTVLAAWDFGMLDPSSATVQLKLCSKPERRPHGTSEDPESSLIRWSTGRGAQSGCCEPPTSFELSSAQNSRSIPTSNGDGLPASSSIFGSVCGQVRHCKAPGKEIRILVHRSSPAWTIIEDGVPPHELGTANQVA